MVILLIAGLVLLYLFLGAITVRILTWVDGDDPIDWDDSLDCGLAVVIIALWPVVPVCAALYYPIKGLLLAGKWIMEFKPSRWQHKADEPSWWQQRRALAGTKKIEKDLSCSSGDES